MRANVLALALLSAACAKPFQGDFPWCEAASGSPDAGSPTWFKDVKPIVDAHCASCHVAGGIAPFPMQRWEEVYEHRGLIRAQVASRQMPPWQPAKCCTEYLFDRSLTEAQVATITTWVDQGAMPGDPADAGTPIPPSPGMSRIDVSMKMKEPYTPKPTIGTDDIRCFVLDYPVEGKKFVTGLNVKPGQHQMVHHVILQAVTGDGIAKVEALDAKDPEPGFDCSGGMGGVLGTAAISGWEPGGNGIDIPSGLGIEIPAGSKFVLNIHYTLAYSPALPDLSQVDLELADDAEPFNSVVIADPLWLAEGGMPIAAGETDKVYWYESDPTEVFGRGKPIALRNVNLHMHEYGSKGVIGIKRKDGSKECVLQIDAWNAHWMGFYWLKTPKVINPGDKLYIECHYDNSPSNHALMEGEKQKVPHQVDWGNDEDMCAGFLAFTREGK